MIFGFLRRKKSVIYGWVTSYMLITILPVLTISVAFPITKNIVEDEINRSNVLELGKVRDRIDKIIDDTNRFSMEVAGGRNMQEVFPLTEINSETPYYTLYNASQELKNYKFLDSSLKRFYLFFNKLQIVIAPGTIYDQAIYYNGFLAAKEYGYNRWLDTMKKKYDGDFLLMPYYQDGAGEQKAVAFIKSLPILHFGDYSANMVVLLDFQDLITGSDNFGSYSKERSLFIIDEKGTTIACAGMNQIPAGLDGHEMEKDSGNFSKIIDGDKFVISYISSHVNGWKYITVTAESLFWEKVRFIKNIMIGAVLLSIAVGGVVSCFYLRKNYNPLKEIVSLLQEKLHSQSNREDNEYGFIRHAFSETLEQKERIQLRLEQQNRALKSGFIASLLKGKNTGAPVYELMTNYQMSFRYSHYTAMAIFIENYDEGFWEGQPGTDIDKYAMFKFIITNVMDELVNRNCIGYMTEVDDILACLINLDQEISDYKQLLLGSISEAREFIRQNYRIDLIVAVGSLHESMEGIPEAFAEAMNALEYVRVMGLKSTAFYDEIKNEEENSYYYPVEKEYQMINCINTGDYNAAANVLEDIFQKNFVNQTPSLEIARCLMFDLTSTVLKTANEVDKVNKTNFIEELNMAEELMKCKTLSEMKNKMLRMLKLFCEYRTNNSGKTDYKVRDRVIEIIEANFCDPNLGIASIAERMDKHPYYISRVFKEQTGEGILEYINKYRIRKAKEFLKEGLLNQEEIVKKVGYTNVRTFQRIFKKQEGISPGRLKG